jgi:rhombotail lipoprotein
MRHRIARVLSLLPLLALYAACTSSQPSRITSSALDFLYPDGKVLAKPARQVTLRMPVRVGLAFSPSRHYRALTEQQKQELLTRVADAFREHEGIGHIEVVPSAYLQPKGSFANLDQLRASLGLDVMVLLSYDQAQFTESTRASWTYLTVVGPLLIEGEKNETFTVVDAVVYDIPSRVLLFRAAGDSTVKGRSSPLNVDRKQRERAGEGFERATAELIESLHTTLDRFEEQAKTGTVQGPGTPAIAMYDPQGERIGGGGGGGGGALGAPELAAAALLGLALLLGGARRTVRER